MRVALTVPEARRLLSLAGGDAERQHHLRWSQWRRTHQATAKRCHTARRTQRQPPMHRQGHIIRVAGTPTLTEELWARLAPLLPPWQSSRGRPPGAHRPILAGLLWMMRAGVGWREIPTEFGAWQTLYSRYRLWCRDGTWGRLVAALPPTQQEDQLSL